MPRRFSTYPRVRTDVAMHQHRKSVGRAPFSTTVLVVGNGARGPVGMWETCRRAQISVVDRWAPCNSQRENAVSTVGLPVFGGRDFAAAELGLRNACIGHWRGGPRGAAAARNRG